MTHHGDPKQDLHRLGLSYDPDWHKSVKFTGHMIEEPKPRNDSGWQSPLGWLVD